MADLSAKQLRILKVLHDDGGWLTRRQMEGRTGPKGFSLALGAPTRGVLRDGSLEQLKYVERRDETPAFEYRITEKGRRALDTYEGGHGPVELM